jgi:hypothetical protein
MKERRVQSMPWSQTFCKYTKWVSSNKGNQNLLVRFSLILFPAFGILSGVLSLILLRQFFPKQDLFGQTILATFLVAAFSLIFLHFLTGYRLKIMVLIVYSISATFFILSQTQFINVDRSRSFYVLSWVDQGLVQTENGKLLFDKNCSLEMTNLNGISLRIDEQLARGFLVQKENRFHLTILGKTQLRISEQLAKLLNLGNWDQNTC